MGIKPDCVLCPNKGGAMKSNKSGKHWAHVSCALWIPEVSIGCVDRMEPITKISSIPQSRWSLICVLCRKRVGSCIQCSVKPCKTAYHVTCAFQHGLEMRAIIEEGNAEDGVKLRSYCQKHSMSKGKKENSGAHGGGSASVASAMHKANRFASGAGGAADDGNSACGTSGEDPRRRKNHRKTELTSEERNQARAQRLQVSGFMFNLPSNALCLDSCMQSVLTFSIQFQEVEAEFDKHVNINDISCHLFDVDDDAIVAIYNYWKLKRKSRHNRELIPPKSEDVEMIARKQEQQDMENHKLVVHLRQDLERVRNLCYMVSRREKLSRSLFKLREQVFYKQLGVLDEMRLEKQQQPKQEEKPRPAMDLDAVIYANDGPTLYDRFYSSTGGQTVPAQYQDLKYILEQLMGKLQSGKQGRGRASQSPNKRRQPAKASPSKRLNNGNLSSRTSSPEKTAVGSKVGPTVTKVRSPPGKPPAGRRASKSGAATATSTHNRNHSHSNIRSSASSHSSSGSSSSGNSSSANGTSSSDSSSGSESGSD